MLYEFITPSDPITFAAPDDKIAFVCALILGNGEAFCTREDGEKVGTCFLFAGEGVLDAAIQETLGSNLSDFMDANCEAVATAFESFAYGGFERRRQYDDALAAITDPHKIAEFKAKHEDRNRSSMSTWVKGAWSYAKNFRAKMAERAAAEGSADGNGEAKSGADSASRNKP